MANQIADDITQKIRGVYRGFVAKVRGIRREERADVEQTIKTIDQKHVEDFKARIQQL